MTGLAGASFDYSAIAVDDAQFARDAAQRVKVRISRTVQDIIEIGRDLIAVKKKLGHGRFLPWIKTEFGMSDETARKFMQASEAMGDKFQLDWNLTPSILYALAAPAAAEIREEAVQRINIGEKIGLEEIRELKAKLADKDSKVRQLKSQKEAGDAHNDRLIAEARSKSSETQRLRDQVDDLNEEIRRLSEVNTLTVTPTPPPEKMAAVQPLPAAHEVDADFTECLDRLLSAWSTSRSDVRDEFRRIIAVKA